MSIKKAIKIPLIILSVLLSLVLLFIIGYGIFYLQADSVKFDYTTSTMSCDDKCGDQRVSTPFFGNSLINDGGGYKGFLLEPGLKNIPVYDAINSYMLYWQLYVTSRYRKVSIDYNVDRDGDNIIINLSGNAGNDGGQTAPVKEKFVFNVSNASLENLPRLTNEEELSKEFVETIPYFRNPREVPPPEWLLSNIDMSLS